MAQMAAKKLKAPHCWLAWQGITSSSVLVPKAPPDGYTVATDAFTGCSAVLTESDSEGYFQLWHHGARPDKPKCGSRSCASFQILDGKYYPKGVVAKDGKSEGKGKGYTVIKDVTPEVLCSQMQDDLTEPDKYVLHTKKCAYWKYQDSKWHQVVSTQTTRVPTYPNREGLKRETNGECKFLTAGFNREKFPDTKTPEEGQKCEVSEDATYTAHSLFYNEWPAQSQYQPMYEDGAYAPGYAFDHAYGYVSHDPYAAAGAGAGYMDPSSVMLMMFSVLFVMIVCVLCCFMNAVVGFAAYMMGKAGSGSGSGPEDATKPKYVRVEQVGQSLDDA
eukprot:CAMPEP_0202689512 /NCGR_PEP_ID=MMETSP1385-20130828/4746_1 /ASSEMBLY_ACC=CAM_ASM_000861 /TAXON_ID=933848 /ORGANISM="Elphidium margaritaceum" /LENGTH=330 /DNA_ID=CAMNT_0049344651 /DNA_START=87 /DNA_END=1079 /DNA_ORIENTATION=+